MAMGKPIEWTDERINEVFPEIFERISEGETIKKVLRSDNSKFPESMKFYEILEEREDLLKRYTRAYKGYKDHMADLMLETAFTTEEGVVRKDTPKGEEVTTGDMTSHRKLKVDTMFKIVSMVTANLGNSNAEKNGKSFEGDLEEFYE